MNHSKNISSKWRLKLFNLIAGLSALIVLFILLLLPMYLFRQYYGIPLSAKGPDGEIWFLVVGGGLGAGVARFVFDLILARVGGYD